MRRTVLAASCFILGCAATASAPLVAPITADTSGPRPQSSSAPSTLVTPAAAPGAEIVIEARRVVVRGAPVMDLPAERGEGADPKDKRGGKNDLYLVPLAAALAGDARAPRPITIDVDDSTPYRMLLEVLFTLAQKDLGRWELRRRGTADVLPLTAPRPGVATDGPPPGLDLRVVMVDAGIAIKASGANLTSDCASVGTGVAIPKRDGVQDHLALGVCLRKLKARAASDRACVFSAPASTPFSEVWVALEAIRGDKRDLFPEIQLGIPR